MGYANNQALQIQEQGRGMTHPRPIDYLVNPQMPHKLLINGDTLGRLLTDYGFRRVPERSYYARVQGKLVTRCENTDILRFVKDLFASEPKEKVHDLMKQLTVLTSHSHLEFLPALKEDFLKDNLHNSYLPVRNGVIRVNGTEKTLIPYEDIPACIWQHKIFDHDYIPMSEEEIIALRLYIFYQYTCSNTKKVERADNIQSRWESLDSARFDALKATIGYMLHRYNNPSLPMAVILTDDVGWDNPNAGGTGKSIIASSVMYLRQGVEIDCRNKKKGDPFFFDAVHGDEDIIHLDDLVEKSLSFDQLYSILTSGLEVNRKGEHHFKFSKEDNPRFVITTNEAVKGSDVSSERRRLDMQIKPFFDLDFKPRDVNNGKNFFEDWSEADWNGYLNICIHFLQYYFKSGANVNGCPPYGNTTQERTIRQEIGNEFVDWMDNWQSDHRPPQNIELRQFRETYNNETGSHEARKFKEKLNKWGVLRKVDISYAKERTGGTTQDMISFNWVPF